MGRTVGLIGEISGKVGNVVFYTRNGVQVTRVYVRNPSNPKTAAQTGQRLKMALAGRLSSIVPYAAIEGFGGTKTDRRSKFLKNTLLATSYEASRAGILEDRVVFSEGTLGLLTSHTVTAGESQSFLRRVDIRLTSSPASGSLPEGYGERFVVLFLNTGTSQFDYAVTGLLTIPTGSAAVTTTAVVRVGDNSSVYRAVVYAYPFSIDESRSGVDFRASYLGTEDGTIVVDLLTGEQISVPLVFGRSIKIGNVELNPPA